MKRLIFLVALNLLSSTAAAQAEDSNRRAECEQTVRVVRLGPTHASYSSAMTRVVGCEGAASALAQRWAADAVIDSAELGGLVYATSRIHDRTLLNTLFSVLADNGRPTPVRRGALDALVSYWRPGALTPLLAGSPEQQDPHLCGLGIQTHFEPKDGDNPLVAGDADRITEHLAQLAAVEADERLRHALLCTWHAMTVVPSP